jgi:hypothetical protein
VVASDPENNALTLMLDVAPYGMTLSPSGLLTWTPGDNQGGQQQVAIAVRDSQGAWGYQSFIIDVPKGTGDGLRFGDSKGTGDGSAISKGTGDGSAIWRFALTPSGGDRSVRGTPDPVLNDVSSLRN